jgi:hypothetical protein
MNLHVEILYGRLLSEKKIDVNVTSSRQTKGNRQTIDMNSLRNRDVRETGSEWLCYQAIGQMKLSDYLTDLG